jgi:PAS domain S-box-containing protein
VEKSEFFHSFYSRTYEPINQLAKRFLFAFTLAGLVISIVHQTWWIGVVGGLLNLLIYFLASNLGAGKAALRYVISFLFGNFSLQVILQMHGSYTAFFVYFVCFTILLLFESWKVLIPISLHTLIATGLIMLLSGSPSIQNLLPQLPPFTSIEIILHLLLITGFGIMCMYWAQLQRTQTIGSAEEQWNAQQQLKAMDANIQFANQLSTGNLKTEYPAAAIDALGESLLTMRKSLIASSEREEQERFHTTGLAEVGEILRKFSNNLDELADHVIEKLVKYMKANQGSLFVANEEGKSLKLMACRAWERKKFLNKTIEIGEGLVGQAVLEKQTIYLTKVPEGYINITSGLGAATPRSVAIVPLKAEELVIGVIELAAFKEFSEHEILFLEKVGESIASTMITARNNQRTRELLDNSKAQEEQLRSQEEEMRQNMEEMQATQEEMERTQKENTAKAKELEVRQASMDALINSTNDSILLMDRNYKVILMNNVLRNRYKGTQYENLDVGSDSLSALGAVRDEWKGYYDQALAGETLNFTIKSSVKGENSYREYFINPVRSGSEIYGLSVFSRDVSKHHRAVDDMKKKSALLDGIINHNTDTYFAIDTDYKIMIVNDVLRKRFEASNVELKPGVSILEKLPKEAMEMWKGRYDKALAGEKLHFKEERKLEDKTLFLDVLVEPIYSEEKTIIGCSVVSRDITELRTLQNLFKGGSGSN